MRKLSARTPIELLLTWNKIDGARKEAGRVYSRKVTIRNKEGLHARPAILLVKKASEYDSRVYIEKGDRKVNASSLTAVLKLDIIRGDTVTITAEGNEEIEVIEELIYLIQEVFPEQD